MVRIPTHRGNARGIEGIYHWSSYGGGGDGGDERGYCPAEEEEEEEDDDDGVGCGGNRTRKLGKGA